MSTPDLKPTKVKEFNVKQSSYSQCGRLPMRAIICGPRGSGKTILLQNMLLDRYKGGFSRIAMFSPYVDIYLSVLYYPIESLCD